MENDAKLGTSSAKMSSAYIPPHARVENSQQPQQQRRNNNGGERSQNPRQPQNQQRGGYSARGGHHSTQPHERQDTRPPRPDQPPREHGTNSTRPRHTNGNNNRPPRHGNNNTPNVTPSPAQGETSEANSPSDLSEGQQQVRATPNPRPNKFLSQSARNQQQAEALPASNAGTETDEQSATPSEPQAPEQPPHRNHQQNSSYTRKPRRHQTGGPNDLEYEKQLFGEARTGIDFTSYDDIPASATGNNVPKQITSFKEIAFGPHVEGNLQLCGYERPTPIQKFSIPIGMANRDMIACAQTGSGKTAAFLLPTIYRLLNSDILSPPVSGNGRSFHRSAQAPQALILSPTRELATQIFKEAQKFTYRTTIQPVVAYGGVPIADQIAEISRGCHLIVATPGRLSDLCERGRISLKNIQMLIFDEADCMLDMGFLPQIEDLMNKYDMPQTKRQTLMFSATFPPEIQRLASSYLTDYLYITIGRVGSSTSLVTQKLIHAPNHEDSKRELLLGLLDECDGLTLIFVETRRSADLLEQFLISHEINAASIHGDRTQVEREQALSYFKSGHCPVLVATDVASRGLSIPNVEYVINYDMPNAIDDYVHRIGRTGRCGARGTATSFVGDKNKALASDLLDNMREAKQAVPEFLQALVDSRGYGSSSSYGGRGGYSKSSGPKTRSAGHADVRFGNNNNNSSSSNAASNYGASPTPSYTIAGVSTKAATQTTVSASAAKVQTSNAYSGASGLASVQASDDAW